MTDSRIDQLRFIVTDGTEQTFDHWADRFVSHTGAGQSESTETTYRIALKNFHRYLVETYAWTDETLISDLDPLMLDGYPAWLAGLTYGDGSKTLSESTRKLKLIALTRFLRFLVLRELLPWSLVRYERVREDLSRSVNPKPVSIHKRLPKAADVEALVKAAEDSIGGEVSERLRLLHLRDLAIVLGLKGSGLRVAELARLQVSDLDDDLQGGWIKGKGRKVRFFAFDDSAWQAIRDYLTARQDSGDCPVFVRHDRKTPDEAREPMTSRSIQYALRGLSEKAGLDKVVHPHALRHWFATRLLAVSDLATTQDSLGHSSPSLTRRYAQIAPAEIAAAVRKLS